MAVVACLLSVVPAFAQDGEAGDNPVLQLPWQEGPTVGRIGARATIRIPDGYVFLDAPATRRLNELFANAQDNERLAVRTHQLSLALMRAGSAADTLRAMVAVLGEDFQGEVVRVLLFKPVDGLSADWLQVVPEADPALAPFRDFLAGNEPLCGRLNQDKLDLLYGDDKARAASAVLLPLPGIGMLTVGSADANRFFPGMGTLFLRLMAESLATGLGRYPQA